MDEDRLHRGLGRLIDRSEDGGARAGADRIRARGRPLPARSRGLGRARRRTGRCIRHGAGRRSRGAPQRARTSPEAAAYAVAGGSTTHAARRGLAGRGRRRGPDMPVVVKYLGRWVVVTLAEIPGT